MAWCDDPADPQHTITIAALQLPQVPHVLQER
jgi:hypothetical protein